MSKVSEIFHVLNDISELIYGPGKGIKVCFGASHTDYGFMEFEFDQLIQIAVKASNVLGNDLLAKKTLGSIKEAATKLTDQSESDKKAVLNELKDSIIADLAHYIKHNAELDKKSADFLQNYIESILKHNNELIEDQSAVAKFGQSCSDFIDAHPNLASLANAAKKTKKAISEVTDDQRLKYLSSAEVAAGGVVVATLVTGGTAAIALASTALVASVAGAVYEVGSRVHELRRFNELLAEYELQKELKICVDAQQDALDKMKPTALSEALSKHLASSKNDISIDHASSLKKKYEVKDLSAEETLKRFFKYEGPQLAASIISLAKGGVILSPSDALDIVGFSSNAMTRPVDISHSFATHQRIIAAKTGLKKALNQQRLALPEYDANQPIESLEKSVWRLQNENEALKKLDVLRADPKFKHLSNEELCTQFDALKRKEMLDHPFIHTHVPKSISEDSWAILSSKVLAETVERMVSEVAKVHIESQINEAIEERIICGTTEVEFDHKLVTIGLTKGLLEDPDNHMILLQQLKDSNGQVISIAGIPVRKDRFKEISHLAINRREMSITTNKGAEITVDYFNYETELAMLHLQEVSNNAKNQQRRAKAQARLAYSDLAEEITQKYQKMILKVQNSNTITADEISDTIIDLKKKMEEEISIVVKSHSAKIEEHGQGTEALSQQRLQKLKSQHSLTSHDDNAEVSKTATIKQHLVSSKPQITSFEAIDDRVARQVAQEQEQLYTTQLAELHRNTISTIIASISSVNKKKEELQILANPKLEAAIESFTKSGIEIIQINLDALNQQEKIIKTMLIEDKHSLLVDTHQHSLVPLGKEHLKTKIDLMAKTNDKITKSRIDLWKEIATNGVNSQKVIAASIARELMKKNPDIEKIASFENEHISNLLETRISTIKLPISQAQTNKKFTATTDTM